jgi:hypothetical protein
MEVLREFLELAETNQLSESFLLLERDLATLLQKHKDNSVTHFDSNSLDDQFEQAVQRLEAARKALKIVNSLTGKKVQDPQKKAQINDFRKKNVSRIMKNLNVLRLLVQRLEDTLAKQNQAVIGAPQTGAVSEGVKSKVGKKKIFDGKKKMKLHQIKVKEDMEQVDTSKNGIKQEVRDAVKNTGSAKKELEKNPFDKNKKVKEKK